MSDVMIATIYEVGWREPVWVKVGHGVPEAIRGPKARGQLPHALMAVSEKRQFPPGAASMQACPSQELECHVARAAFIQAAQEAEMIA